MPATNKTEHLGLNDWVGTDKPKRSDFTEDNKLIDAAVGGHINDTSKHFSESDRERWDGLITSGMYFGTGESTYTLNFEFSPKMVLVFLSGKAPAEYNAEGSYPMANWAIAIPTVKSGGITMSAGKVTLSQSQSAPASGGTFYNLNKKSGQYGYLAIR